MHGSRPGSPERGLHELHDGQHENDGAELHEHEAQLQQPLRSGCIICLVCYEAAIRGLWRRYIGASSSRIHTP